MQFEFSAGGVVYKKDSDGLRVLLIKPADEKRPQGWSLPKGRPNGDESPELAAVREVKEETGIDAEIIQKIGDVGYFIKSADGKIVKDKKVTFFLMKYLSGDTKLQENETREVAWVLPEEALEEMAYKDQRETLEKAFNYIKSNNL